MTTKQNTFMWEYHTSPHTFMRECHAVIYTFMREPNMRPSTFPSPQWGISHGKSQVGVSAKAK